MSQNELSTLHAPTGAPPTPTPTLQSHISSQRVSKAIMKTALQRANAAVILDKANDLSGAIDAYSEAVNLLNRVLSSETKESDRKRLQETYDKYLKRIHYLNTLKSDTDHLYETFQNGTKSNNNRTRTNHSLSISPPPPQPQQQQQQHQGERQAKDTWVRKMTSSSSLNNRSNRMESDDPSPLMGTRISTGSATKTITRTQKHQQMTDSSTSLALSPTLITPTSPSSSISIPMDVPPSPISSKSTPSRPTSNRKSNDAPSVMDPSFSPTPPLEPRSTYRPSPRKSSRIGAAVALQHGPSFIVQDYQQYTYPQRRSSITSLSSSSSGDSDSICATGPYQPTMALPSLLLPKTESTSTSIITTATEAETEINLPTSSNNTTSRRESFSSTYTSSHQDESTQQLKGESGRHRTTSLPRKLHFTRPTTGIRMQRLTSNASSLDTVDSSSTSAIPMRRNVTQPSAPNTTDPDLGRSSNVVQRQSSGLSMRKKYNRLSRSSMDGGAPLTGSNHGRKDKSGPTLSALFGDGTFSSGRPTQEALNYFGNQISNHSQQQPYYGLTTTTTTTTTTLESTEGDSLSRQVDPNDSVGSQSRYLDTYLKLIISLEHSMNHGGYVTPNLFIPRGLWYQSNIRLSSMDIKVAACETLIMDLNRLEKWRNLDDIIGSLRLIESLEVVVDGLQVTLSKKLKRDSLVDTNDDTSSGPSDGPSPSYSHGDVGINSSSSSSSNSNSSTNNHNNTINSTGSTNKRAQLMSWGSKLTKSVERMNAFSLTKVEDQYRHYIEVLQKLFIKLHLLEMWFQHYLKKDRLMNPHYDTLLSKLGKVCDGINRVVGGFVIRDLAILLGKWLKRGGALVNE